MSPLRLALVTRRFWPLVGGAEVAMANLAVEFQRQGQQPTIVTARWEKHWPTELVHREVPVVRLPQPKLRGWGTLRYMYALGSWLAAQQPKLDGVLVSMLKHDAYAAIGAWRRAKIPVVLRAEGGGAAGDCAWQQTARFGLRIRQRCQQADAIVAPSDAIERELREAGYSADRIVRIDNGVAIPPPRSPGQQEAARSALAEANWDLKCDSGAPLVVYTGRLHPDKGLADLVQAWPAIATRWPQARLWLIGEGPQREELFGLISDLGFRYKICLPGSFDEIDDVLAAADLFVLPSYSEGMSLSLLEAMAAGLPVVASDIPGNRALVTHEREGLLAPPGDAQRLAAAIAQVLSAPARGVALGAAGRSRVSEHFSLEKMARQHLELIHSLRAATRN
jgi:glycosyltransferase involved in cell wall biosynthesis